jgi:SAM-dependent methyltransferase
MSNFKQYAKYYNLLYADKNYQNEVDYIDTLIKKYSPKVKTLLDIGSGTGNHDILLLKKGYEIDGVDMSQEMVDIGNNKTRDLNNICFHLGSSTNFKIEKQFDAVLSLFHVMSYQTTNDNLYNSLKNAYDHLKPQGIFIFDFWYGPGVLTDLPALRVKTFENNEIIINRICRPEIHANSNIVDVNYEVLIEDKKTNTLEKLFETHHMRYLFMPELHYMLTNIGFKISKMLNWMSTTDEPNFNSWNACLVAQK